MIIPQLTENKYAIEQDKLKYYIWLKVTNFITMYLINPILIKLHFMLDARWKFMNERHFNSEQIAKQVTQISSLDCLMV